MKHAAIARNWHDRTHDAAARVAAFTSVRAIGSIDWSRSFLTSVSKPKDGLHTQYPLAQRLLTVVVWWST